MEASYFDLKDDDLGESANPYKAIAQRKVFTEPCWKCAGTGFYSAPSQHGHHCFACKGKGTLTFATSKEVREKNRAASAVRKAKEADRKAAVVTEWISEHPAEGAWLQTSAARGFEFAVSLLESLNKWGTLTPGQLGAVQKCIAKAEQRKAEDAARAKDVQTVNIEAIEVAFGKAKDAGIKWPKLRLSDYVFSPAGENSKNPGAIYVKVKATDDYLGKIQGGKFWSVRGIHADVEADVVSVASDPHQAAVAYGKKFGVCAVCGRELTDHSSIERGIGPICADKYGW